MTFRVQIKNQKRLHPRPPPRPLQVHRFKIHNLGLLGVVQTKPKVKRVKQKKRGQKSDLNRYADSAMPSRSI